MLRHLSFRAPPLSPTASVPVGSRDRPPAGPLSTRARLPARTSEASHLRALFDHSLEAILLTALDGTVLAANAEAGSLFLRSVEDMAGLRLADLACPADARAIAEFTASRTRGRFAGSIGMRRGDGSTFLAEVTATTFREGGARLLRYVFVRDVSQREAAEQALLANEHRYRSLVESTGSVLVGIAADGMVIEWNREAERLFGWRRREVLGSDYFRLIADDARRDAMRLEVARVLAGEPPRPREDAVVSRHGDVRMMLWTVTRLQGVRGEPMGVIASGQDITERKRLEAQVQHAQKLESLGVLAGGIAHDFNNLLVGILGNASLALMDVPPGSELHAILRDVETAALRAADLTRQMLAYSGRGRFVVRRLELSQLVREMAHLLQSSISKRALLRCEFDAGSPMVEGDATQLRQVVMNLITNASDALDGENGSITLRTTVEWAEGASLRSPFLDYEPEAGHYVVLEVADSGIGMTPETMQRIFDPFFSTKFTGRGLGLAATLGIVRGHGGTITVDSAPGRGTTFRVYLPVAPDAAPATEQAGEVAPAIGNGGLALVVDDDATVREVARQMLERRGFQVEEATDGMHGLERYRELRGSLRLALIDLTMPRLGGQELAQAIRAVDDTVPIILMSGFCERETVDRLPAGLVSGCIQKPFRCAELAATLSRSLAASASPVASLRLPDVPSPAPT